MKYFPLWTQIMSGCRTRAGQGLGQPRRLETRKKIRKWAILKYRLQASNADDVEQETALKLFEYCRNRPQGFLSAKNLRLESLGTAFLMFSAPENEANCNDLVLWFR